MWTVTIKGKTVEKGSVNVLCEFTNGTEVVNETIVCRSAEILKDTIINRLKTFENTDTFASTIALGTPDTTEVKPTAAELARIEWIKDYNKWVSVKKNLIDTNILTGNEAPVTALQNKVKTNFLPAYINFI